jgi:hypothetical protein
MLKKSIDGAALLSKSGSSSSMTPWVAPSVAPGVAPCVAPGGCSLPGSWEWLLAWLLGWLLAWLGWIILLWISPMEKVSGTRNVNNGRVLHIFPFSFVLKAKLLSTLRSLASPYSDRVCSEFVRFFAQKWKEFDINSKSIFFWTKDISSFT